MSGQEIIRPPWLSKVPRTPAFVDGIANLRGVVLPVLDMRTRFGMERAEEIDLTRILVIDTDGVKTGLRVDRVKQVTRVLQSQIEPPAAAIRGSTSDYLEGFVKLDNGQRIVMSLNAAQVCQVQLNRREAGASGLDVRSVHEKQPSENLSAQRWAGPDRRETEIQKLVTFRIAREGFAFPLEHV